MKRKQIAGIVCLAAGVILLLACLPGLLLSRVENDHAPLFLRSIQEESAVFALLLNHLPETAGIGAVLILTGLLCLTELPDDDDDTGKIPAKETVLPKEDKPQEIISPSPRPEFRMDFPEERKREDGGNSFLGGR